VSEDVGSVQGPTTDTDNGSAEPQENKAPWADYLEPLPDSVRPLVEPVLRKWDADTTQRFQRYSQQLEPYKAWDPVIQEFQDPQVAQQAAQLMHAINTDPEQVYRALAENFGFGDQGNEEPEEPDDDKPYVDPEFATVKQMTEAMAEIMLAQQQEAAQAQEDAELDQYIGSLKQQYGDFDEEYVLAHMSLGLSGEQAVGKFQQLVGGVRQQVAGPPAPTILGSGGGLPSQAIDPGSLTSKDARALVAQMLSQAAQADQT